MPPVRFKYPISVAILYYTGEQADLRDSWETAVHLEEALKNRGHVVRLFEVTRKNWRKALHVPGKVVFNFVEDETWELYTKIGLLLSKTGRAQIGHEVADFKYAIRKALIKRRMKKLGIATPDFRIFNRRTKISNVRGLEFPLIVKPSGQHASVGISQDSVVIDQQELAERVEYLFKYFPGEVVAEEFIEGREFHVTVIGNGNRLVVLPYVECAFVGEFKDNWDLYTYDAKWKEDSWEYWGVPIICPVSISKKLDEKIQRLTKRAFRAFYCRDIVRFDIRVNEKEEPMIIDMNMNPGIDYHENEETWKSAKAVGWTYDDFIETLVGIGYHRVYGRMPDRVRERQYLLAAGR